MKRSNPTPNNYLRSRHRHRSFPKSKTGPISRTVIPAATTAKLYAEPTDPGVYLWHSSVGAESYRLEYSIDKTTWILVEESITPWLVNNKFLHAMAPFGESEVTYRLMGIRNDQTQQIDSVIVDLSAWGFNAPVIDSAASSYNAQFLTLVWTWDGNAEELEIFEVYDDNDTKLGDTFKMTLNLDLGATAPSSSITVYVLAKGTRYKDRKSLSVTIADEAATGGDDGDPKDIGDPALRSTYDHRAWTPNLCRNSSAERIDLDGNGNPTGTVPFWTYSNANPFVIGATFTNSHGLNVFQVEEDEYILQEIIVRGANTDVFSMSLEASITGGDITIKDKSNNTIVTQGLVQGINIIENFRVPSTDDRFLLRIIGAIPASKIDKVMVNQGPTIDPWALDTRDSIFALVGDVTELTEDTLADILADFQTVWTILGGESGSIIQQHTDSINLIVGELESPTSGTYAWIQLVKDQISAITSSVGELRSDVIATLAKINMIQAIINDPETGATKLFSEIVLHAAAIYDATTGLNAAHVKIDATATIVDDPETGVLALNADLSAQASTLATVQGLVAAAQAGVDANSGIITGPDGNVALRSQITTNTNSITMNGSNISAAQTQVDQLTSQVNHSNTGLLALNAAIGLNANILSLHGTDITAAEASITANATSITDNEGDITSLFSTIVLKVHTLANGKSTLASVAMSVDGDTGSEITLTAESIDIIGITTFINNLANTGTTTILGGAIDADSSISIGAGTNALVKLDKSGYMQIGKNLSTGRVFVNPTGISVNDNLGGSIYGSVSLSTHAALLSDQCRVADTNGNIAILTPTALTFQTGQAPSTAQIAAAGNEFDPEIETVADYKTRLEDGTSTADTSHVKITKDGYEWQNSNGTTLYRPDPPEELAVSIDMSSTANGNIYQKTVTITTRHSDEYNIWCDKPSLVIGTNLTWTPVLGAVYFSDRTTTNFKINIEVWPTTVARDTHTLQIRIT